LSGLVKIFNTNEWKFPMWQTRHLKICLDTASYITMGRGEAKSSIYLFEWLGKQASKSYKYQVFTVTLQRFFSQRIEEEA
jgi:hypothetical protein